MRRWKMSTMIRIGIVTTTAPAAIAPLGSVNCEAPRKNASATGAVRDASVDVRTFANRKSFHAPMKVRMPAVKTPGHGEREDHPAERLHRRRPVHLRGLLEVPRDLAEERRQDVDRDRQREREVGEDQPDPGVVEADLAPQVEEPADDRDRREHRDRERAREDRGLALELQPRDRVRRHRRERQRDQRRDQRDADRVAQRGGEEARVEDGVVVVERPLAREEPAVADRLRRLQRQRDDPDDGDQGVERGRR